MPVTIFRSRLRPDNVAMYRDWADRMSDLAEAMPGHVSHKTFTAEDGERVTIVEFADEEGHSAWATHPEHIEAKKLGLSHFYAEYEILVCDVRRRMKMKR